MKVEEILHMIGGCGETSYAANSRIQENAISKAKFLVQETVLDLYCTLLPDSLAVADLGCSSGPNTLTVVYEIIETISNGCRQLGRSPPEVQFFLNDLPGNDFNTIFRSLPSFEKKIREDNVEEKPVPLYVVGVPGSFYRNLFPNESIHFIHSSYSVHFLSQIQTAWYARILGIYCKGLLVMLVYVPPLLGSGMNNILNKRNIYISRTSPPYVFKAYLEQFQKDFSNFLKLRSKEVIPGGFVVLTFLGRKNTAASNGEYFYLWDLLADSLNLMVLEGILQEEQINLFNLPFYAPSMEEVKHVIQQQGSFDLKVEHIFETNWDVYDDCTDISLLDKFIKGENVAKTIRAVLEPVLACHFGEAIINDLFSRYAKNIAMFPLKEKTKYVNFVISLKKKG